MDILLDIGAICSFVYETYFGFYEWALLKHRYNLIPVLCMKRIFFFTNGLLETWV
jgi:hypothetical protein